MARRRTRIPHRANGQLLPAVHTATPPGPMPAGPLARPPVPRPVKRGEQLTRADFIAMPAAAVYYADRVLNMENGGVARIIQPKTNPVVLEPGGTQRAILDTGLQYDQYVVGATGIMIPTTGPNAGIPSNTYLVDVKRRNMGAQNQTDQGFVAFTSVFGNGIYPHFYSILLPFPNSTQYLIELRNQTQLQLEIDMNFIVIAKQAMDPNRIDVHH